MDRPQQERELRAARNQSMFRMVNETTERLNQSLDRLFEAHTVICECADPNCLERVAIDRDEYAAVREEPRRFVVLPGHVHPEVERVAEERDGYLVVEKLGEAGVEAEVLAHEQQPGDGD